MNTKMRNETATLHSCPDVPSEVARAISMVGLARVLYLLQKLFGVFFLNCDFCKSATDSMRSPTAMVARPAWLTPT